MKVIKTGDPKLEEIQSLGYQPRLNYDEIKESLLKLNSGECLVIPRDARSRYSIIKSLQSRELEQGVHYHIKCHSEDSVAELYLIKI